MSVLDFADCQLLIYSSALHLHFAAIRDVSSIPSVSPGCSLGIYFNIPGAPRPIRGSGHQSAIVT